MMFFSIRFSVRHTHLLYWLIGVVCHESQNGEDYHAAEDGGAAVAEGDQHAVLMAIALELAVRGQGNDAAAGRTQRKDDLRRSVSRRVLLSSTLPPPPISHLEHLPGWNRPPQLRNSPSCRRRRHWNKQKSRHQNERPGENEHTPT